MLDLIRRRRILKKISALDLIPMRARGHEIEEKAIIVLVPKFESKVYHIFSDRLKKLFFRIRLDKLGSATWEAIDGTRTVRDISDFLQEKSGTGAENLDDLDERLSKYMTMLYERRFITFKQLLDDQE